MRFHWKTKILLLGISLSPLLVTAMMYYYLTVQLENRLVADNKEIFIKNASHFLHNIVDNYSRILNRDKKNS